MQEAMKMLQPQISPNGGEKLQSLQEDSLVNRLVVPGSEEARKITATSGRTCSIALSKSDPLGLLAKMLLESPRWHSKVRMLKWESKPICLEKVTVMKSVKGVKKTSLGKSAQILKVSVIPSKHSLFRLVPWEPPTEGTECLSSRTDLLKTPTAFDAEVVSGEKNPTPGNSGSLGQEVLSAYIQKRMPSLLPTPLASEGNKYANKYNSRSQMGRSLSAMGGSGLLPTPRANEVTNINLNSPNLANRNHYNLEEEVAKHVCSLKIDGETFRLSPLFVEEMMGFPLGWTALPFLSQDGERKV